MGVLIWLLQYYYRLFQLKRHLPRAENKAYSAGLSRITAKTNIISEWEETVSEQLCELLKKNKAAAAKVFGEITKIKSKLSIPFEEVKANVAASLTSACNGMKEAAMRKTGLLKERFKAKTEEWKRSLAAIDKAITIIGYIPEKRHFWENNKAVFVGLGVVGVLELPLTFMGFQYSGAGHGIAIMLSIGISALLAVTCHIFGDKQSRKEGSAWLAAGLGLIVSLLVIYIRSQVEEELGSEALVTTLAWLNLVVLGFGLLYSSFIQRHLPYWNAVDYNFQSATELDAIETEARMLGVELNNIKNNNDQLAHEKAIEAIEGWKLDLHDNQIELDIIEAHTQSISDRFEALKAKGSKVLEAAYDRGYEQSIPKSKPYLS